MAELKPMMQQYETMKTAHPDCILLFRLGDFYEMFNADAVKVAAELNLTLTTRDRNKPEAERTPMCGVPYHAAEAYIARLVAKGYKVAICEQMTDPATTQGLVERDVVRIVTPGTVIAASMLEEGRSNFLCAIYLHEKGAGVCFCDVSTGEVAATIASGALWRAHLEGELARFSPKEAVLSQEAFADGALRSFLSERLGCSCQQVAEAQFDLSGAQTVAQHQFKTGLDELPEGAAAALRASGGLLSYLYETQKTDLGHLTAFHYYSSAEFMELGLTARRNLELTETMRAGEKRGTLLWVLAHTKTPMGGRLLRAWLERPLLSPAQIDRRLGAVEALYGEAIARDELRAALAGVTDLERIVGRVSIGTAGARELVALQAGLSALPKLRQLLAPFSATLLTVLRENLDDLPELCALLSGALADEPPVSVREGGLIRDGYNPEVDALRAILKDGKSIVAAMEASEREKTGIRTLKVGYNRVFGYFIDVSKAASAQVPDTYIRKQTLVSSERFITPELKEMEQKILSAQDKVTALEFELFTALVAKVAAQVAEIQASAAACAQLDVLANFAAVARANGYVRPAVDLSDRLDILEGRHPVVEQMLRDAPFVPNDVSMDCGAHVAALITGPNMAGKSTFMRQVALIVLMAQIGCFVPAKSAHIGVVDRIFTRVGASDDLAAGQSTFMVEMTEVAELLQNATPKSLLILDEIGRGTSTYDGMSIARAVLEHCADKKRLGAKTLFATHYHELTCLEGLLPGIHNFNAAAKKRGESVVFLRKIIPGPADESYGIEVAGLAGVPAKVIARAREILQQLETEGVAPPAPRRAEEDAQVSLGEMGALEVAQILRQTSAETLSPIEALNLIYALKKKL